MGNWVIKQRISMIPKVSINVFHRVERNVVEYARTITRGIPKRLTQ